MTAGDSKAALTITPQPALATSPQPRPAPTARALPPGLVAQVGQNWTPIVGQNWMPIDKRTGPVSSTAATMRAAKKSPPDSSVTLDLSQWTRGLCGLPVTPSRLGC